MKPALLLCSLLFLWASAAQPTPGSPDRALERLASAEEADGSVLDRTVVLYGSSNSETHNNSNYPLVLAGGKSMGFKHGHYHRFDESVPLSNLHLTMLRRVGIPVDSFADSNSAIPEVLS